MVRMSLVLSPRAPLLSLRSSETTAGSEMLLYPVGEIIGGATGGEIKAILGGRLSCLGKKLVLRKLEDGLSTKKIYIYSDISAVHSSGSMVQEYGRHTGKCSGQESHFNGNPAPDYGPMSRHPESMVKLYQEENNFWP